jgi:hypothetical protein
VKQSPSPENYPDFHKPPENEMRHRLFLLFPVVALVIACATENTGPVIEAMPTPSPDASAEPHLGVANGSLILSWLVHHSDSLHTLQYAVHSTEDWSDPRTIHQSDHFFANWADRPSVAQLHDGTWVAHWLEKSGAGTFAYDVRLSHSSNGVDWSPSIAPHDDGTETEHGFVSLVADGSDGVVAVWLDGRDYAHSEHDEAEMSLRAARWSSAGVTQAAVLDTRTCDCCPTSAVATSRGILVGYRDRGPKETRDISLVRFESGSWSEPWSLRDDGWVIKGCPVNGPALDAQGDIVSVAWYTGAHKKPTVYLALSADAGETFNQPVRIDDGNPAGRVDVTLLENGDALAIWLEAPAEGDAEIRARRIRTDGRIDPSFLITQTAAARASGYPQVVRISDTVYIAWTEASEPSRIRMATLTNLE